MLKRIFHIVLAFYLLAITAGIAISKHYCGGDMVSFSLYLKAQSCAGMGETMEHHCCDDVEAFFQLKDDFTFKSNFEFLAETDFSFVIPEFTFLQDILSTVLLSEETLQIAYSPPLIATDIPVEVQSFLI